MKKIIKTALFLIVLSINPSTGFGQTGSDNIIFLTDFYTSFTHKVKADHKHPDSLYKASIQKPIYETYFQKSEYAYIVKDYFSKSIESNPELSLSIDRITLNKETITAKITRALKSCRQHLTNDSLSIYIIPVSSDNRKVIEAMSGIMGLTAGSKQIILTIEPGIAGWEQMLEYAVAHEFNHAYWTHMNFGKSLKWTLLDYMVFEGKGDYFAHLLYPNVMAPWALALTEKQKSELWRNIKPNLQNEDINYQLEVMFGSGNYPVWGGYSLGYDIVLTSLKNKTLKAANWTNLSSDTILEQSAYK